MLSIGDRYDAYLVTNSVYISEIQSTLIELVHEPTGAHVMHIANDDDENLFNLSFKTHPDRSDGVAHILEHTVLCGSEKFPVRDPFFGMSRRSLNTFMNALTGADFTCYPASSQVPQDFYNLLDVYLDAVFKPTLSKLSFLQEGHRLEFLKPDDPNSPLLFKGIVFNEMKGAMATPDSRLIQALMHALFPDLTYGVNSGGDPKHIPSLTYQDLRAFHQKFYHPSRCLFYFYGNLPTESHLDFLETHAFKDVQKLAPLPKLPKQPRFQKKVVQTLTYPISEQEDLEDETLVGMTWLTCSILDDEDLLALNVLDLVLTGTDASPLKMALLKSDLCKQADSGIDNELSEVPFSVVCKGCPKQSAEKLEQLVLSTLKELAEEGIEPNLIEAAIHQIEMSRLEITGNSSPYGLSLFWRSALLAQHGGQPEDGLRIHTLFQKLREHAQDPSYFSGLISRYFLNNPHFVLIEMQPDVQLAAQELNEEKEKLASLCRSLNDNSVQDLIIQAQVLSEYQRTAEQQDLNVLPKISLDDVQKEGKEFLLTQESCGNFELFYHPCFTNEITYADLIFDLPYINKDKLPFLRLFTYLLPQIGCGGRNYEQHLNALMEHTGGIGASLDLHLQAHNPELMRPSLSIRGKALNRKLDKLFPMMRDVVSSADFTDKERLGELLMQHQHSIENSIQHHSLRYAVNLAARGFSTASSIISSWAGLDYYWALNKIVEEFEHSADSLINEMLNLQNLTLGLEGAHLAVSCENKTIQELKKNAFFGLDELPSKAFTKWKEDFPPFTTVSQGRITASPVAFTAQLFPSVAYTHALAAATCIASEIMENKTLHTRIREQGGAYGSGAVQGTLSGQFYFYAYRDPHLKTTIQAFAEAVSMIEKAEFDDQDIEEAKLGLFQNLDSPVPPGARAITSYARKRGGLDPNTRQHFRDALFSCSKQEIQNAAEQILSKGLDRAVTICFAGKDFLDKENALLQNAALPLYPID